MFHFGDLFATEVPVQIGLDIVASQGVACALERTPIDHDDGPTGGRGGAGRLRKNLKLTGKV